MAFFGIRGGGGSGGVKVLHGTAIPTSTVGKNGDFYLQTGMKGALLHFDSSAILDENGGVWTANGSPVISNIQSKFGGNSLYLDGSSYIQSSVNSDAFNFGKSDFTISCWIYPTTTGRKAVFAMSTDCRIATDILFGQGSANLWMSSTGNGWDVLQSDSGGGNTGQGTIPININEWIHIAYVRKGANVRMYVNGQVARDVTLSNPNVSVYWSGNDGFRIGRWGNNQLPFTGYIDEFIVVNGVALWEDTFTPPTQAFDYSELSNTVINAYVKNNNFWKPIIGSNINDVLPHTPTIRTEMEIEQGDFLFKSFSKVNSGWAIGIYNDEIYGGIGYYGGMLIGKSVEDVDYGHTSSMTTVTYNGETYYVNTSYWDSGNNSDIPTGSAFVYKAGDLVALGLLNTNYSIEQLALAALQYYYDE